VFACGRAARASESVRLFYTAAVPRPAALSRLRLGEEIGRGALASVVRVHDTVTGSTYAGKILHASHEVDDDARWRFAREADLLARVEHPNIVCVFGNMEIDGRPVVLMELVEGESLAQLLARTGALPPLRALELVRGIVEGLAVAHAAGIIHRDLKPANVLVTQEGVPKIADFGMARGSSFAGVDKQAFSVLGTPDYMAPECLDPLAVDARTDLYALGCMLYEMLVGTPPYGGATAFAVLDRHVRSPIPELPRYVPSNVAGLVRSLLAKSPADRPQAAAAVREWISNEEVHGPPARLGVTQIVSNEGRCAGCGSRLVHGVAVCLDCGLAHVWLEPGDYTLFVTGPGRAGDKLDALLRERLLAWIEANPLLRLDPKPLAKSIPRLPFVLAQAVSFDSAERMAASLAALGLVSKTLRGGTLALPEMRAKAKIMGGRATLIGLMSMTVMSGEMLLVFSAVVISGFAIGASMALAKVVRRRPSVPDGLAPMLAERLERVSAALPAISAKRHREGLRAVLQRVVGLHDRLSESDREAHASELARAVDLAVLASSRLDALDRQLSDMDLRSPTEGVRACLHERDTWSSRLLDLTAALESLRARWTATTRTPAGGDDELLDLRARIEALEEVAGG